MLISGHNTKNVVGTRAQALNIDFFKVIKDKNWIRDRGIQCIVSNPPFSLKTEIVYQLIEMDIPFMMILPVKSIFQKDYTEYQF